MKTTLILGATTNPDRYAYIAAERLARQGHVIIPLGVKQGRVQGQEILNGKPDVPEVDTVTLYLGPRHQPEYYDWLLRVAPRRIIFNPGTENAELMRLARANGIEVVAACTLVMLAAGSY
ncbi:CoA-binding protein [Neolewinella sp.]|uniref:CoA-binding protein n=1 Tax=Neolewinella sp. TaxID=2993543 RepID=UPI003B5296F8